MVLLLVISEISAFWHISELFIARFDFVPLLGCFSSNFWVRGVSLPRSSVARWSRCSPHGGALRVRSRISTFFGTFMVGFPSQVRLPGAGVSRDGSRVRNSRCLRGFRGMDVPRPNVIRPPCHKRRRCPEARPSGFRALRMTLLRRSSVARWSGCSSTAARSGFDPVERRSLAYFWIFRYAVGFCVALGCFSSGFWISRCFPVAEQCGALVKMCASRRRTPGSIPEIGFFWLISEFFVARLDFVSLLGCFSSDF